MKTTIAGITYHSAVRIGDLWIRPDAISSILRRYSQPLLHINDDEQFGLTLRGTMSCIEYRGHFFGIVSKHQLQGLEFEKVGILSEFPNKYVTSAGYSVLDSNEAGGDKDRYDLVAFDFTPVVQSGKLTRSSFFPAVFRDEIADGERVVCAAVYGFAYEDCPIEFSEDIFGDIQMNSVHQGQRELVCGYFGNSFEDYLFELRVLSETRHNLDGFSGAAALLLTEERKQYSFKFGGMVLRGGGGSLHCLKNTQVRRLLDQSLSKELE